MAESNASPIALFHVQHPLDAPEDESDLLELSLEEDARLMRMVCRTRLIRRHIELFQMMRGEVQFFVPHQILVSAWGRFDEPDLAVDVISELPGVRTRALGRCDIAMPLRVLHKRWCEGGRRPILLDGSATAGLWDGECGCAVHGHLRLMHALLLHGVQCARDGTDALYLLAHDRPLQGGRGIERFRRLADLVLVQIDAAYRRVAGFHIPGAMPAARVSGSMATLSPREEEIMRLISEGRTNMQIAGRLGISLYTVKNHVQSIIRKLGTHNRTGAVAVYRTRDALPWTSAERTILTTDPAQHLVEPR